jgi:hypothetical protein
MYGGKIFHFEAGEAQPMGDDEAAHLLLTRQPRLRELKDAEIAAFNRPGPREIACPFCGLEFADKTKNPKAALSAHLRYCKQANASAAEESADATA